MDLADIISRIDNGENLLFHGPGGTGKTYAIKSIVKHYPDKNIMVMASTGKAAVALDMNASTIHRALDIFPVAKHKLDEAKRNNKTSDKYTYSKRNPKKIPVIRLAKIDMIIIDEISMVGRDLLEFVNIALNDRQPQELDTDIKERCICTTNKVCKCAVLDNCKCLAELVMGGTQVIFCGDFYQLPPIGEDWCFKSDVWKKLHLSYIRFDKGARYQEGPTFDFLGRLRVNKLSAEDKGLLKSRKDAFDNKEHKSLSIAPIVLYSTNKLADDTNYKKLAKLEGDEEVHEGRDEFKLTKLGDYRDRQRKNNILDDLAPQYIAIKVGAKILITRNFKNVYNLVNGAMGIIIGIEFGIVKVQIEDGSVHDISPMLFEVITERYSASRVQYPFRLGWAITIHKSQGTTLDSAIVKIDDAMSAGQVYVAMSRVKDINRVYIEGQIHYSRIRCIKDLPPEIL